MKKSCLEKESKVVTTKVVDGVLNDRKEEHLTEEQIYINRKLSESGIKDEGLGWLEKRNILKTINVSLNCTGSEKLQRTSPRFSRAAISKPVKWVENSFENTIKEDSSTNWEDDKNFKTKLNRTNSDSNSTSTNIPKHSPASNKITAEGKDQILKSSNWKEIKKDVGINGDSPKTSKKVHYVKIQVEKGSKEECNKPEVDCNYTEDDQGSSAGRKRTSPLEVEFSDGVKKLKMGETNNGVPLEEETPLKIELELERRRRNTPFIIRDIKAIVSECECRNKKWKETFSEYESPARWGIPIVKNCAEKWDGKRIPPKLLHRYQKYLSSNNLFHPIFHPVKPQTGDLNITDTEIGSQSSSGTHNDSRDDLDVNLRDSCEVSFVEDESKKSIPENNLSPSTSDNSGRMVLRNRNQQKPVIVDEDEYSSEDSDEWFSKQKPNKKQKTNSKSKKSANPNKQLVLKLERCNINKKSENEENGRNGSFKNDESYSGGLLAGNHGIQQVDGNSKLVPDPDTMVCPICSLRFKKQLIESHATECASKTYKD